MIPIRQYFTDADRQIIPDSLENRIQGKQPILEHLATRPNEHKFNSSLYGHIDILKGLQTFFNGKCAFCEQSVGIVNFENKNERRTWQIEHFRPKNAYFWLGYVCTNFLVSCSVCNQIYKKTYFPIANEERRAKVSNFLTNNKIDWSKCDTRNNIYLDAEQPLLLNPVFDRNFSQHFEYQIDGSVKGISEKGIKSVEFYGLDRDDLCALRHEIIDNIRRNIAEKSILVAQKHRLENELEKIIIFELKKLSIETRIASTPFIALRVAILEDFDRFILSNDTCFANGQPFKLPAILSRIYHNYIIK